MRGDWHETMSTHWFHDHMFSFTAQNVYKGMAGMFNIYSSLDRGNEAINDGVNLRLPSGTAKDFGNLDYDVNLMLADKAWDANGQLNMDIFNFDGFLGDVMTVNLVYKPFFEVERRKYRYDIVIDFSRYSIGQKVQMVNLAQHVTGLKVDQDLSLSQALSGTSPDPCVGTFLEFRIVRNPATPDVSQVPATLIPNPDLSTIPVARTRTFVFDDRPSTTTRDPVTTFITGAGGQSAEWGIGTDSGQVLSADFGRVSAAPRFGTRETWTLVNGRDNWDHPIHIHFEEGQILARTDNRRNPVPVSPAEQGRKDVYRLHPGGSVTITMQFRDWGGMFMEHCHNTMHEDNAMLLRWEIDDSGTPFLRPLPTPIPTPQGVTFQAPDDILPNI